MTRTEVLELATKLMKQAYAVLEHKGRDYATEEDGLRSFRQFGKFGIIVRLSDKLSRLQTICENKGKLGVPDETEWDTVLDIINYAILYGAHLREEDREAKLKRVELIYDVDINEEDLELRVPCVTPAASGSPKEKPKEEEPKRSSDSIITSDSTGFSS